MTEKSEQKILVTAKEIIFGENNKDFFEGFKPVGETDYESRILANLKIMRRGTEDGDPNDPKGNAETDTRFKQPIGYAIVYNPTTKQVFAYQRSKDKEKHDEHRMLGNWSWGFGGHIEAEELKTKNPIKDSLIREVTQQEIEILGNIKEPKVLGYLYHDHGVNAVHFGILYIIETDATEVRINDPEIARVEKKSFAELEKICELAELEKLKKEPELTVDDWSKTALIPLKDIV
ncbi:MAG: hypothetical protein ABIH59_01935 [archaeon]